jgi:hypothetical protein
MPISFLDGLTIDIEKIPHYHEIKDATFTEKLDEQLCESILESENPLITNEIKAELKKNVVDNLDEKGILETKLYQENNLGRFYYKDDITISQNKYCKLTTLHLLEWKSIDIQKAGLSILSGIAKNVNIETPIIDSVISDFDAFTSSFAKYNEKNNNVHYKFNTIHRLFYQKYLLIRNKNIYRT